MSIYYNDRGILTYSYIMNKIQIDEDVSRIDGNVIYVKKNGLYWIEGNTVQKLFNNKQTIFIDNYDFTDIIRLIVVNKDTSIFVSPELYYIYHKGQVRFSNRVGKDFDLYRFNFIRNNNKLFNLYRFSETLFDKIPEDCKFYIQFNNRNFTNPHDYFNISDKQSIGNILIDIEFMDKYIRVENIYYIIKNEFRSLNIDLPLEGIQDIQVSDDQIMLYFKSGQSIYHQGILYNVPSGSRLY